MLCLSGIEAGHKSSTEYQQHNWNNLIQSLSRLLNSYNVEFFATAVIRTSVFHLAGNNNSPIQ